MAVERADVVVVGGGVSGLSSAYFLAKAGKDVVVVEKGTVGSEASGRNGGMISERVDEPPMIPMAVESLKIWPTLDDELGYPTEFTHQGRLQVAVSEEEMGDLFTERDESLRRGISVEELDPADVVDLIPGITGRTLGGLFFANGGHANPQRTVHADYRRFLDADGLRGARIGAARNEVSGFDAATDRVYAEAIAAMRDAGAEVIDPADIPTIEDDRMRASERLVMMTEFKHDIGAYLATRVVVDADMTQPRTLADLIQFNLDHAEQELALFGQEQFERAQESGPIDGEAYLEALATGQRLAGAEGLDVVLDAYNLDALIAPTGGPAPLIDPQSGDTFRGGSSRCAAVAGYPLVTVPAGFVTCSADGGAAVDMPIGLTFMGRAWSEPTLIRLAYAFEGITQARRPPQLFSLAP